MTAEPDTQQVRWPGHLAMRSVTYSMFLVLTLAMPPREIPVFLMLGTQMLLGVGLTAAVAAGYARGVLREGFWQISEMIDDLLYGAGMLALFFSAELTPGVWRTLAWMALAPIILMLLFLSSTHGTFAWRALAPLTRAGRRASSQG